MLAKSNKCKLIIIALISILFLLIFALVLKDCLGYSYRVHQNTEKEILLLINYKQDLYKKNNGQFASQFDMIGFKDKFISFNYNLYLGQDILFGKYTKSMNIYLPNYLLTYAEKDNYVIFAVGNIDADSAFDVWMISEKGIPVHLLDDYYLKENP